MAGEGGRCCFSSPSAGWTGVHCKTRRRLGAKLPCKTAHRRLPADGPLARIVHSKQSIPFCDGWKQGGWEDATLSFPGCRHLAPSFTRSCHWLPASRRCAGLHGRLQALAAPQRSRPDPGFPFTDVLGEASQLLGLPTCRPATLEPAPDGFGSFHPELLAPGRHRALRPRSLALRYGSCLLSLKLRFHSQAGDLVCNTARARMFLQHRPRPPCGRLRHRAQSAMVQSACASRGRTRNLPAARFSSETARMGSTTLAHSSNCPVCNRTVSPRTVLNPDGRA